MKITLAQLDPLVGDVAGNLKKVTATLASYASQSDLIVFSELFLVGYPPRDLLEKPALIEAAQAAIQELLAFSRGFPQCAVLLGAPMPTGLSVGKGLHNSALLLQGGEIIFRQNKSLLPTYDVFDETRHFDPAARVEVFAWGGETLGISICEDAWYDPELWSRCLYPFDPIQVLADKGATLLINISSSPFQVGKEETRLRLLGDHSRRFGLPFIYVNQVGGNDELIFDGCSLALDRRGEPLAVLPAFREAVATVDSSLPAVPGLHEPLEEIATVHEALVLGIRDYLHKCGFSRAVVGLSGGVDSAVTCCLAQQALGAANVLGVLMPSPFSSAGSLRDSRQLVANLGIPSREIPITPVYEAYLLALKDQVEVDRIGVALENIQARIRGNLLMALSNEFGYLVLSTGNKSEMAVGYCTLYGDMSGGLSVLADVPKTMVYELAHYLNRERTLIPQETITKPPSAELRPDQKDQDTLPPYDVLDQIMNYYLTEGYCFQEITRLGFAPETVRWVIRAIDRSEYKRRQAAPGLKITSKAFGMGRRIPIAARHEF